ncbi:MAG: hypothetical protein GW839_07865 [Flavobacteriales bacterium]|nr:hypothetical protein [Flavobacteriia bacterium]NCP07037.1 hypothetical protein [Flavobacteriales bacterium]PIV92705.1 MAG: hypothetical protein COW44_13325 [Flavobacteriaceae bacterium CG17_big_fil_post_rev_8_21_14_2_50_33_15]PIY10774.1 MAG: hypothetical protein COZ17_08870 [Flavobacteriaceae bacterium CG_4_10_14_3_um_filter_33_47]PJB18367.1 MAG: hypothetical protein CO117_08335 [Flavobacteriaceae bacterium CG_4_9_14_3_um_filter_33_16]
MFKIILIAVVVILVTIGLVKLVDKFIPSKFKPILIIVLWVVIGFLGYQTFMSVYEPIQFNKIKNKRYAQVITNLIDIRDAQLAHRQVTGKFADNFDNLVKFIDTAQFTITQRRDSTIIDLEATKRFGGVTTTKEIIVVDTLGFVPVKDSLFKTSTRYKTMMNVPVGQEGAKFELKAGILEQNEVKIPVFEAKVKKDIILFDQPRDLVIQENQVVSVDGVNGNALKVGSMDEVNTTGNWPKTYGAND